MRPGPAFVVVVSALSSACREPVHRNPPPIVKDPPPAPVATPSAAPVASASAGPEPTEDGPIQFADYPQTLNPKDGSGRFVYLSSDKTCYVERPDKNPPNAPPGMVVHESTPCPPQLTNPAWAKCFFGRVRARAEGTSCICDIAGNPPPPPKRVACPK